MKSARKEKLRTAFTVLISCMLFLHRGANSQEVCQAAPTKVEIETAIFPVVRQSSDGAPKEIMGNAFLLHESGYFLTAKHVWNPDIEDQLHLKSSLNPSMKITASHIKNYQSDGMGRELNDWIILQTQNPAILSELKKIKPLTPRLGYTMGIKDSIVGYNIPVCYEQLTDPNAQCEELSSEIDEFLNFQFGGFDPKGQRLGFSPERLSVKGVKRESGIELFKADDILRGHSGSPIFDDSERGMIGIVVSFGESESIKTEEFLESLKALLSLSQTELDEHLEKLVNGLPKKNRPSMRRTFEILKLRRSFYEFKERDSEWGWAYGVSINHIINEIEKNLTWDHQDFEGLRGQLDDGVQRFIEELDKNNIESAWKELDKSKKYLDWLDYIFVTNEYFSWRTRTKGERPTVERTRAVSQIESKLFEFNKTLCMNDYFILKRMDWEKSNLSYDVSTLADVAVNPNKMKDIPEDISDLESFSDSSKNIEVAQILIGSLGDRSDLMIGTQRIEASEILDFTAKNLSLAAIRAPSSDEVSQKSSVYFGNVLTDLSTAISRKREIDEKQNIENPNYSRADLLFLEEELRLKALDFDPDQMTAKEASMLFASSEGRTLDAALIASEILINKCGAMCTQEELLNQRTKNLMDARQSYSTTVLDEIASQDFSTLSKLSKSEIDMLRSWSKGEAKNFEIDELRNFSSNNSTDRVLLKSLSE